MKETLNQAIKQTLVNFYNCEGTRDIPTFMTSQLWKFTSVTEKVSMQRNSACESLRYLPSKGG